MGRDLQTDGTDVFERLAEAQRVGVALGAVPATKQIAVGLRSKVWQVGLYFGWGKGLPVGGFGGFGGGPFCKAGVEGVHSAWEESGQAGFEFGYLFRVGFLKLIEVGGGDVKGGLARIVEQSH